MARTEQARRADEPARMEQAARPSSVALVRQVWKLVALLLMAVVGLQLVVLALVRQVWKLVALLLMAVVGIGIAVYLTLEHYQKAPLICSTTGTVDCAPVLTSPYSVVPGTQLPITVPGMLWFIVSGALAVVALRAAWLDRPEPARLRVWQLAWSGAGLLFVLYLVYAEIVLVHKICAWCTGVHVLTLLTFLLALMRWQEQPVSVPVRRPARVTQQRPVNRSLQPTSSLAAHPARPAATGATQANGHPGAQSGKAQWQAQKQAARSRKRR